MTRQLEESCSQPVGVQLPPLEPPGASTSIEIPRGVQSQRAIWRGAIDSVGEGVEDAKRLGPNRQ